MVFERTEEKDFSAIKQLYWDAIDYMDKNSSSIGWRKGIYPSDEFIKESTAKGEMYVLRDKDGICAAVILNSVCNEGYKNIKWAYDFSADEIFVPHALVVRADIRGRGIGKIFIENIFALGRKEGKKAVRLDIMGNNSSAEKLYLKTGFVFAGEEDMYYKEAGWAKFRMFEKLL